MKILVVVGTLLLVGSPHPLVAAESSGCGTGVLLEIQVRDDQIRSRFEHRQQTASIYSLTVRFGDSLYTAESNGGRIALFGPLVAGEPIDISARGRALVLTRPLDLEPEVATYEMEIVKIVPLGSS